MVNISVIFGKKRFSNLPKINFFFLVLFEHYINSKIALYGCTYLGKGTYSGGEAFIWENTIYFFISVIYCSTKIH